MTGSPNRFHGGAGDRSEGVASWETDDAPDDRPRAHDLQQARRHHCWLIRLAGQEPFRMFAPGDGLTLDEVVHVLELRFPGAPVERVAPVR